MSSGPRSFSNPYNTGQGSAFHELVFTPTFMPDLARPYHVPGSDAAIDPVLLALPNASASDSGTVGNVDEGSVGSANLEERSDPRLLFVHVTIEWTKHQKSSRNNTRAKKQSESKTVSRAVDVLSMTRAEFISTALSAHNYQDVYVAGVASGPSIKISWSGSSGGKAGAAAVLFDDDWKITVQQLSVAVWRTKSVKLDTVRVVFDLDLMEGFKQRHKRAHSPDPYELELSHGTRVPHTNNFTPAQIALGAVVDEIKAAHSCVEHGACFITGDLRHIEMNRFRLNLWAEAVLAGHCLAGDPPPKELLDAWNDGSTSKPKPRGRTGPSPAVQPVATSSNDTANLLLATLGPVMAMMAQNMGVSTRTPANLPVAARSPERASSPPPDVDNELEVFMELFRVAKKIPSSVIVDAIARLRPGQYSPDVLCEPSVTTERLGELTGLAEGQVHQLKKFARQWSGKIEGKRARRGI
ncbi:hypothetical protein B0H19DRAFT_1371553 [Mycena capillaripes]|nr:hypothetical protein B0H19DRAFT_1371553 [Mycena capillaripes]